MKKAWSLFVFLLPIVILASAVLIKKIDQPNQEKPMVVENEEIISLPLAKTSGRTF